MQSKTSLRVRNITKTYSPEHILRGITHEFEQKKSYAIVGASGSGKSTLLHIIGGLDEPTSGEVMLGEKNIHALRDQEINFIRANTFGFVFQFHYLIKELTAVENVAVKGRLCGLNQHEANSEAMKKLTAVEIGNKAQSFPHQLSGGEQQRVAIARAMMGTPDFLFADEPTGNLDKAQARNITDFILRLRDENDMCIIVCTHDHDVSSKMDKVLTLENGLLT
ncbi:ABC transporter ATP-binding protein [bacterium]|nr:ABC transporter ATP-binding protein [bacterium]